MPVKRMTLSYKQDRFEIVLTDNTIHTVSIESIQRLSDCDEAITWYESDGETVSFSFVNQHKASISLDELLKT